MLSFSNLLNTNFLIFLGILLLIAFIVVYFESKIRDQNHKISTMLSLVSTLAEDINGIKVGLTHFNVDFNKTEDNTRIQPLETMSLTLNNTNNLITVSDDEYDDDDSEDETDDESDDTNANNETDNENDDESEEFDDENRTVSSSEDGIVLSLNDNVKILKLNIQHEEKINEQEPTHDITSEFNEEEHPLELTGTFQKTDAPFLTSELKTININLEESQHEQLDFKKLPLSKLRSVVAEKGLSSDLKLKKPELLKLLRVEQ
jgi:hypothetical protein